jgi:hypothetical protein
MATSPQPFAGLLPDASYLTVDDVYQQDGVIVMIISAVGNARCPACGICSCHVHSRYCRTLRDLVRELSSESACVRTAFIAARKIVAVGFLPSGPGSDLMSRQTDQAAS